MSQEFSLLNHLGVSIPEGAGKSEAKAGCADGHYRVVAPTKRPPVRNESVKIPERRMLTVPFADFSGEVIAVSGKSGRVEKEYLIFDAKVPSIGAVNKQLGEAKRAKQTTVSESLSSYNAFARSEKHNDVARRQLLENLQKTNWEQAQRKKEEIQREQKRRSERELIEIKAAAEASVSEELAVARRKRAEVESVRQANMAAMERKRLLTQTAAVTESCTAFPWHEEGHDVIDNRGQCRALMDANKEMATAARVERQRQRQQLREWATGAEAEAKAYIQHDEERQIERRRHVIEQCRLDAEMSARRSKDAAEAAAVQHSKEAAVYGESWFPLNKYETGGAARRAKELCLAEENRKMAEEHRRQRAEAVAVESAHERERLREVGQIAEEERHRVLVERQVRNNNFSGALEAFHEEQKQRSAESEAKTAPEWTNFGRGPLVEVLYRCPVTGQVLTPEQFGLARRRETARAF